MQLRLLTLTSILSLATLVESFVPQQRLLDLQGSFDAVIQRASEAGTLKSSRAEPISANTRVVRPKKVAKKVSNKVTSKVVATRQAVAHKKWGVDNTNEDEYWYDSRIHTLGNHGFMGAVR